MGPEALPSSDMRIPGLDLDIDTHAVPWRESSSPGVRWYRIGEPGPGEGTAREAAVLIEMAPGRGYPPHRHLGVEEVLVLAGGYRDDRGEHRAGSYVRYEAGSQHAPVALGRPGAPVGSDNPACVLFAIARAGIERLEEAPRP